MRISTHVTELVCFELPTGVRGRHLGFLISWPSVGQKEKGQWGDMKAVSSQTSKWDQTLYDTSLFIDDLRHSEKW